MQNRSFFMENILPDNQPLAEVFGFTITDFSPKAKRFRKNKLCPYGNKVPSCTKDKAKDPLGVCSVLHKDNAVITCPIRFREGWIITEGASQFFFKDNALWTSILEVNLADKYGKSAGHVDIVLVEYDNNGRITDFGALEIQAVYISGNVRRPFQTYMTNTEKEENIIWKGETNYPKPDYLSSSRKRLIPQILYKGGILKNWGKKQAVALQKSFFSTLPRMPVVNEERADIAWFLYDLKYNSENNCFNLVQDDVVYTEFEPALDVIIKPEPGDVSNFMTLLQDKLDEKLNDNPPDAPALTDIILQ